MTRLKYIKHHHIDFEKWDNTILLSEIPFVFAQSFYLNATCPHWDALVIGDYESVFPITYKSKFGYRYLPQPSFTSQLGAYGKINLEVEKLFYEYIIQHFSLIDLEFNAFNQLKTNHFLPKNTFTISYSKGYSFNQNTKRNIAKAKDAGLHIVAVNERDILKLSQTYLNSFLRNDLHLTSLTVNLMDDLLLNALKTKSLYTFQVLDSKNTIKALAHFISNGKHALYLKGTQLDKNSGSMHLLLSQAIEFFSDKSDLFDFGGGSNSQGLASFYAGLGGEKLEYGFLRVNKLPRLINFLKKKR